MNLELASHEARIRRAKAVERTMFRFGKLAFRMATGRGKSDTPPLCAYSDEQGCELAQAGRG